MNDIQSSSKDINQKSFLVIGVSGTELNPTIAKFKGFTDDVAGFSVSEMAQLYWISDYNVDVVIVIDKSQKKNFLTVAYTIIRMASQNILLISEGQSIIDQHNTSNIQSKYDAFLRQDADHDAVVDVIRQAERKRQFCLEHEDRRIAKMEPTDHPGRNRRGISLQVNHQVNIKGRIITGFLTFGFLVTALMFSYY